MQRIFQKNEVIKMEKYIFTCPACGNMTEIIIDEKREKVIDFSREIAKKEFSQCTECGETTELKIEITSGEP